MFWRWCQQTQRTDAIIYGAVFCDCDSNETRLYILFWIWISIVDPNWRLDWKVAWGLIVLHNYVSPNWLTAYYFEWNRFFWWCGRWKHCYWFMLTSVGSARWNYSLACKYVRKLFKMCIAWDHRGCKCEVVTRFPQMFDYLQRDR